MRDKLYNNAGELTRACIDEIMDGDYSFFDNEDMLTREYLLNYSFKTFGEGLDDVICNAGYSGDMLSADEKTDFIRQKCSENNVNINPAIVKTWFTDKRPVSSERSRENVYKLCFALKMNEEESAEFFMKVYYECPFNFRVIDEAVYFYCLKNGENWLYSQVLIEKANVILKKAENTGREYQFTSSIGKELRQIKSETEFLDYVLKHSSDFLAENTTALKEANRLIKEVCDLAINESRNMEIQDKHLKREKNIDLFIYVLTGDDVSKYKKEESFAKASEFPELVKSNFPLKMQLSKIRNNEKVSYDTMRKALIILNFYRYYATLFKEHTDPGFCVIPEDFISFVEETNDLLFDCGYPMLYVRNPFDWMIMHCGNADYPLEEFKDAFRRYYFDNVC